MAMQPGETQTADQLSPITTPDVPVPPRVDRLKWVFRGPNGLRALWRLAIFLGTVVGVRFGISGILRVLHLVKPRAPIPYLSVGPGVLHDGLGLHCVVVAAL